MPSSNPLWFGYYPGDRPIPKRPDQRFPTPQVDMSDMGLNAALDEAINAVEAPANLPKQLWDWHSADWKQKFLVTGVAYKQSGGEILEYDPQEGADVKGVNPALNLYGLVTDPKKELGKMWGTMINPLNPFAGMGTLEGEFWTDLDTTVEKDMWSRLLGYRGSAVGGSDPLGYAWAESAFAGPGGAKLNLKGQGIYKDEVIYVTDTSARGLVSDKLAVTGKTDAYDELAGNIMGFVAGKKSVIRRNPSFTSMQTSFIEAAATELGQKRTAIRTTAFAHGGAGLADGIDIRIADFLYEADIITNLEGFSSGMANFGKLVSKNGITGPAGSALYSGTTDLDASVRSMRDAIDVARNGRGPVRGLSVPQRALFDRDIKGIEGVLDRVEAFSTKIKNNGSTWVPGMNETQAVLSELNTITGSLNNLRYGAGSQGSYLMSVTRRYFRGDASLLKTGSSSLLGSGGAPGLLTDGYKSLDALYPYLERMYMYEDGRDILQTIAKGNFPKVYAWWGQINVRVQHYTPAYWTGRIMNSTHMLGLDYDSDWDGHEVLSIFKPGKNPLLRQNKFDLSYATMGGSVSKLQVNGGLYLGTANNAWNALTDGKLVGIVGGGSTAYAGTAVQKQAFFDFINGKGNDFLTSNAGMSYVAVFGKNPTKGQAQALEFKDFLVRNSSQLGLTLTGSEIANTPQNEVALKDFFKALNQHKANPGTLDYTAKYFGGLQWLSAKLTGVQQIMFNKVGKFFAPVVYAKNAIIKKVADFGAKVAAKLLAKAGITAALGAATGGIATVLAPLIEKVLQATLSKIADKSKELIRAVIKGNFTQALDNMMNDAMKATEKVITCGCFVPLFLAFAGFMMMANIIVSISPVDRAKSTASSASAGGTPFTTPPPVASGVNCPLQGASLTLGSYTVGGGYANAAGHGSRYYWERIFGGGTTSLFSIPYLGSPRGFTCPGGYCSPNDSAPYEVENPMNMPGAPSKALNSTPYYGYAGDFASGNHNVNAPGRISCGGVDTAVTSWQVTGTVSTSYGCGVVMSSTPARYRIFLLHLNTCGGGGCSCYSGTTYNAGDGITTLWSTNPHVHIELTDAGTPQRPESCVCR